MRTPKIDVNQREWEIINSILKKNIPKHEVWAFGSRVEWEAAKYSDLDLVIIADSPLELSVSARLTEDFSESDLSWEVDVVEWATLSESFKKIIKRKYVVLQKS